MESSTETHVPARQDASGARFFLNSKVKENPIKRNHADNATTVKCRAEKHEVGTKHEQTHNLCSAHENMQTELRTEIDVTGAQRGKICSDRYH